MPSSAYPISDGAAGVAQIVDLLAPLKTNYGRLPSIRAAAVQIVDGAGDHDQAAQVVAIARFVREHVRYLADPLDADFIQTPDVMLLAIAKRGFVYGDCDDSALLFASLCQAVGIPCDIVGVTAPGSAEANHVVCVAHLETGDLTYDLVAKGRMQPGYSEMIFRELIPMKIIIQVNDAAELDQGLNIIETFKQQWKEEPETVLALAPGEYVCKNPICLGLKVRIENA